MQILKRFPKTFEYRARHERTGIPTQWTFATKLDLGLRMIERCLAGGPRFDVVACDERTFQDVKSELGQTELAGELRVRVLPALSTANLRELLRAVLPLVQLTPAAVTQAVVRKLVQRARATGSRLRKEGKRGGAS